MAINLRNLAISDVVVHQVPKRDRSLSADAAITFSDAAIPDLDPTRRNFFGERINASLLERSFEIVPLPGRSPRSPSIAGMIAQGTTLVDASKAMARALYNAHPRVNAPAADGRDPPPVTEPCVAGAELQHDEAMQESDHTEDVADLLGEFLGDLS